MARDPRTDAPDDEARDTGGTDVRPVVAVPSGGASTLLIGSGVLVAGLALFLLLNGHRHAAQAPAVRAPAGDTTAAPAAPPLYVPPETPTEPAIAPEPAPPPIEASPPPRPPRIVYEPQSPPSSSGPGAGSYLPPPPSPARGGGDSALVIDTTGADGGDAPSGSAEPGDAAGAGTGTTASTPPSTASATTAVFNARSRATLFAGRGTTVPQGTLIPAVLETALDSTRPGLARAIVSRDVRGFDGSRVLIPRGSRLTGDYRSDVAAGQKRAMIVWTRLVRPDGAVIALASPSADTLGRSGIKAKVNGHFLARFTGAILQTALDIGINLASRPANGAVILGLPASGTGSSVPGQGNQVTPTLTIKPGTSIGVLVSRDLDFADVESHP